MKAYKLTENTTYYKQGRILCQYENQVILLANCVEPQRFVDSYTLTTLKNKGIVEEVELENEKKMHPHLYKPIKHQILS